MARAIRAREEGAGFLVWLILAVALVLRVWLITDKNLWLDESVSWRFATGSVSDLVQGTAADIHPPLYYLILKGWVAVFGDSLAGLRSLSVVCGVLAAYLMLRLIGRTVPRVIACAGLWWFALAPHAVFFSQEARMYAGVTAAVLATCLAYRRWVDTGFASGTALVAYGLGATVCLYLHYFTGLVIAAIWLHALLLAAGAVKSSTGPRRRLPLTPWVAVNLAIGLLYLPWIAIATSQISRGQSWREAVTIATIPANARGFLAEIIGGMSAYSLASVPVLVAAAVLAIGVTRLAVVAARSPEREREAFYLLVALVPIALGLALLPFTGRLDLGRYLPFALPFLMIAAARGLATVPMPAIAGALLLVIGSLATLPALASYYRTAVKDSDARPIASLLESATSVQPGLPDTVFVAPGYMDTALQFISREKVVYRRVESGANLWETLKPALEPSRAVWLVVDYRWPGFRELGQDPRLSEVEVPKGDRDKIKLFRVSAAK